MPVDQTYDSLLEEIEILKDEFSLEKAKRENLVKELEETHEELAESHQELSDSINYAQRIQKAIMPPDYFVEEQLPNSFILYKPRDVVSGDFYFVHPSRGKIVFSAVDCTGHGVPGALMSVIGFKHLDQAIREKKMNRPGEILSYLDEGVNNTLRQTAGESGVSDGMDLGLCAINFKTRQLEYAGAFNPAYIVSKGQRIVSENAPPCAVNRHFSLTEIKADRFPIGVNLDGIVDIYTNHAVQLEEGDTVYLFTDGYADQFGGPKGKKFKYDHLKELLLDIQPHPMKVQKEILDTTIKEWMGPWSQTDDILVMGVRI
ncbi:MAG: hypothetical protein COA57_00500 [Flavobacteriales bacterium]|nr:MAG: hypothetical protein COA57_00500 [Flavobacteriales bacterium]